MPNMHYTTRMDQIMGFSLYRHRTLRTLFDCHSTEWELTSMDKKLLILELLIDSSYSLNLWISDYKEYFEEDLVGKKHVTQSLGNSLRLLYKNASPDLKSKMYKAIVPHTTSDIEYSLLNDLVASMLAAKHLYG
jgi:hypothetical protein